MKVRLILEDTIYDYCRKNARAKNSFSRFIEVIGDMDWQRPKDILHTFNSADILHCGRVVFNIGGNNYRLICGYAFSKNMYTCLLNLLVLMPNTIK